MYVRKGFACPPRLFSAKCFVSVGEMRIRVRVKMAHLSKAIKGPFYDKKSSSFVLMPGKHKQKPAVEKLFHSTAKWRDRKKKRAPFRHGDPKDLPSSSRIDLSSSK